MRAEHTIDRNPVHAQVASAFHAGSHAMLQQRTQQWGVRIEAVEESHDGVHLRMHVMERYTGATHDVVGGAASVRTLSAGPTPTPAPEDAEEDEDADPQGDPYDESDEADEDGKAEPRG